MYSASDRGLIDVITTRLAAVPPAGVRQARRPARPARRRPPAGPCPRSPVPAHRARPARHPTRTRPGSAASRSLRSPPHIVENRVVGVPSPHVLIRVSTGQRLRPRPAGERTRVRAAHAATPPPRPIRVLPHPAQPVPLQPARRQRLPAGHDCFPTQSKNAAAPWLIHPVTAPPGSVDAATRPNANVTTSGTTAHPPHRIPRTSSIPIRNASGIVTIAITSYM